MTAFLALILALLAVAATPGLVAEPVDEVNVFTGTSNSRWMLFPGATLPFGLVKLSPDNQGNVWNGGYEYTVNSVSGFSHLHAFSLSGVSLMPVTGPMEYNPGLYRVFPGAPDGPFGSMWTCGYRSRIRKETEHGAARQLLRRRSARLSGQGGADRHDALRHDAPDVSAKR